MIELKLPLRPPIRLPEAKKAAPIYVTRPDLPNLEDFIPYLQEIWDSKVLTNGGQFHHQFEQNLCDYLGVKHIALFTNATIGLVTALQALRITLANGDVTRIEFENSAAVSELPPADRTLFGAP